MKRFENKVAIVTGGSRDLGRAVSVQLQPMVPRFALTISVMRQLPRRLLS